MLQEKLKSRTKANHNELENLMFVVDIMNKTLNFDKYQQLLITNFIIHQEFEPIIFAAIGDEMKAKLNLAKRDKRSSLAKDVKQANIVINDFDHVLADTSFIDSEYKAIGALYVLEGATLGGNVIYKKLKLNENITNEQLDFNYYSVYQDQLMPNWISFVTHLNTIPETQHEDVINGAKKTFETIADVAKQVKSQYI